jgi:uncharacterized protein (DUF1786 family)
MKILTVDIGTGTQDIFLYDSNLDIENGFKLVLPSPTLMVQRRIKEATNHATPILLTGSTMGGGPSAWAAEAHARAGLPIFATPEAAKTFNDELDKVEKMGIHVISDDEASSLPSAILRIELKDFDFPLIAETFSRFHVSLTDLAAVCVAVFDHGNAPPGISDRQFRFDYLDERIRAKNSLTAFAYTSENIPAIMTRLRSAAASAGNLPCPLIVMDTAPAAVLGATYDPTVASCKRKIIVNVGNFHVIAFRLGENKIDSNTGVEGVFEHHTGEINRPKLENYIRALADGSLQHADIFEDMGHGALVYGTDLFELGKDDFDIVVTGPRRSLFQNLQSPISGLRPYFATPFGDMMLCGNIGMLAAAADILPVLTEPVRASLQGAGGSGTAPWDVAA